MEPAEFRLSAVRVTRAASFHPAMRAGERSRHEDVQSSRTEKDCSETNHCCDRKPLSDAITPRAGSNVFIGLRWRHYQPPEANA
jgi:hypothetical protein